MLVSSNQLVYVIVEQSPLQYGAGVLMDVARILCLITILLKAKGTCVEVFFYDLLTPEDQMKEFKKHILHGSKGKVHVVWLATQSSNVGALDRERLVLRAVHELFASHLWNNESRSMRNISYGDARRVTSIPVVHCEVCDQPEKGQPRIQPTSGYASLDASLDQYVDQVKTLMHAFYEDEMPPPMLLCFFPECAGQVFEDPETCVRNWCWEAAQL